MKRLVLFDIDGTILSTRGAAARAFREALLRVFGTAGPTQGYSFAGRTDPQIARDLLTMAGIDSQRITTGLDELWTEYLALLDIELERVSSIVFPGVRAILDRLHAAHADAALGLLTGNVRGGARIKLGTAGFDFDRFRVGAFGCDHWDRHRLPAIARDRARLALGRSFQGKEIVIIGDTPADVACGASLGVRTIAVATGTIPAERLAACGPDFLFDDLRDSDAVWDAIFS
jgi:phosphoglycolate phosphatase